MNKVIWPHGTKDGTFFTGMMLMSSVHLDSMHLGKLSPLTTALKLEAMRLVRERVQQPTPDSIISCMAAIACLATCALVCEYKISLSLTTGLWWERRRSTAIIGFVADDPRYGVSKAPMNTSCTATLMPYLSKKQ